jgi:hypothetical protein
LEDCGRHFGGIGGVLWGRRRSITRPEGKNGGLVVIAEAKEMLLGVREAKVAVIRPVVAIVPRLAAVSFSGRGWQTRRGVGGALFGGRT